MDSKKSEGGQDGPNDIDSKISKPPKRNKSSCIFDCDIKDSKLISPRDRDSWNTIVRAAEIRKHAAILQIASRTADGSLAIFTRKRDLEKLSAIQGSSDETRAEQTVVPKTFHRRQSTITSDASRVCKPICIFL